MCGGAHADGAGGVGEGGVLGGVVTTLLEHTEVETPGEGEPEHPGELQAEGLGDLGGGGVFTRTVGATVWGEEVVLVSGGDEGLPGEGGAVHLRAGELLLRVGIV